MDTMLTPQDVADILALSYDKALDFIKHSGLEYNLIGRQYRVSRKKLEAFLDAQSVQNVSMRKTDIYHNFAPTITRKTKMKRRA